MTSFSKLFRFWMRKKEESEKESERKRREREWLNSKDRHRGVIFDCSEYIFPLIAWAPSLSSTFQLKINLS